MKYRLYRVFELMLLLVVVLVATGCGTMGVAKFTLGPDLFDNNQYETIRKIVIEEAASNGFSRLTSEVKPSKYNNWKGELYFKTETIYGVDQLTVEFSKVEEGISVYIHGAGIKANAESAEKAITARLDSEYGTSKPEDTKTGPASSISKPQPKPGAVYLLTIKNSNIRAAPTTKSQIITTIKKGTKLEKISESREWFEIRLPSGETGHIYKPLVVISP